MPRRESEESRIAHYFSTAPLDKAETILEVARGILKRRKKDAQATTIAPPPAAPSKATSFDFPVDTPES